VRYALTREVYGNYHPLTFLSYELDVSRIGLDARGQYACFMLLVFGCSFMYSRGLPVVVAALSGGGGFCRATIARGERCMGVLTQGRVHDVFHAADDRGICAICAVGQAGEAHAR